ncbi:MAG TPA: toll/interleukin-1 receptor domain-containing protein, partial [Allosphingosinicella sp.]|nr:toll/interleukin-1 receptor domain-containing protein [Allosphingosinicella sp.]
MADVVICYAGADSATAARMAGAVSAKGYRLWSEEALASDGVANVADRVGQARAAIVIWSEAAAASDWVKAEANFARGQRKLIQCSADG